MSTTPPVIIDFFQDWADLVKHKGSYRFDSFIAGYAISRNFSIRMVFQVFRSVASNSHSIEGVILNRDREFVINMLLIIHSLPNMKLFLLFPADGVAWIIHLQVTSLAISREICWAISVSRISKGLFKLLMIILISMLMIKFSLKQNWHPLSSGVSLYNLLWEFYLFVRLIGCTP